MTPQSQPVRTHPQSCCPITGQSGAVLYDGLTDRLWGTPGRWTLRANLRSDTPTAWLDPAPLADDLPLLYRRYYTHGTARTRRHALRPSRLFLRAAFAPLIWLGGPVRARRLQQRLCLDDLKPGRLLEIGCGGGQSLAVLKRRGWHVEGQEIDPTAAEQARRASGAVIHLGTLGHIHLRAASYDVVGLSHVIEHTPDPVSVLRYCGQLLRPGGRVTIITPNLLSRLHQRFGRDWRDLDPPRHLQLFSPQSLRDCCSRAGLMVTSMWTSNAQAELSAAGSWELRQRGKYDVTSEVLIRNEIRAKWYQCVSWFGRATGETGEEIVAIAHSPPA